MEMLKALRPFFSRAPFLVAAFCKSPDQSVGVVADLLTSGSLQCRGDELIVPYSDPGSMRKKFGVVFFSASSMTKERRDFAHPTPALPETMHLLEVKVTEGKGHIFRRLHRCVALLFYASGGFHERSL
jgi:hypothetical protein